MESGESKKYVLSEGDKHNGKLGINKYLSEDQKMWIIPSECLIFSPVSPPRSHLLGAGAGNHLG